MTSILFVGDSKAPDLSWETGREVLSVLEKAGYECDQAHAPEDAVVKIAGAHSRNSSFDIVITGWKYGGEEFIGALRADSRNDRTTVLATDIDFRDVAQEIARKPDLKNVTATNLFALIQDPKRTVEATLFAPVPGRGPLPLTGAVNAPML